MAGRIFYRLAQHPTKPGTVTMAGKPSHDMPVGTYRSILRQSGLDREEES